MRLERKEKNKLKITFRVLVTVYLIHYVLLFLCEDLYGHYLRTLCTDILNGHCLRTLVPEQFQYISANTEVR